MSMMMEILIWSLALEPLLYLCVAGAGGAGYAVVSEDGVSPWLGGGSPGPSGSASGAVRPSVLGHRRMGLRPVLVGKRHPFDLLHCAGNFAMALVLLPCRQVLTRLMRNGSARGAALRYCLHPHTALGRRAS